MLCLDKRATIPPFKIEWRSGNRARISLALPCSDRALAGLALTSSTLSRVAKPENLDTALADGLKQAKTRRMYFAFVVKGGTDGALIVAKKKIPPTAIAEAKKKCGGSAVIRGACFGEDGKWVFETAAEPPATLGNALKIVARRDTGLTIAPLCRIGTDPDLADDGESPPDSAPLPGDQAAPETSAESLWKARLAELTPGLKNALVQKDGPADQIKRDFAQAQQLAANGEFTEAIARLDAIANRLQPSSLPADSTAAPSAPDGSALWNRTLAEVTPLLKSALAAGGEKAQLAKQEFAAANALAQKSAFAAAVAALERLRAELLPAPPSAPSPSEPPSPQDTKSLLIGRLNALASALKQVLASKSPHTQQIQSHFSKVNALLSGPDWSAAENELATLEALLKTAPAASGAGGQKYSPVAPIWKTAHDQLARQFQTLQGRLSKLQDAQLEQIVRVDLARITSKLRIGLQPALDALDDAEGEARSAAVGRLQPLLDRYHKLIDADPVLAMLDDNPFGVQVNARATLGKALAQIAQAAV